MAKRPFKKLSREEETMYGKDAKILVVPYLPLPPKLPFRAKVYEYIKEKKEEVYASQIYKDFKESDREILRALTQLSKEGHIEKKVGVCGKCFCYSLPKKK